MKRGVMSGKALKFRVLDNGDVVTIRAEIVRASTQSVGRTSESVRT
jgi:hypothetical protein